MNVVPRRLLHACVLLVPLCWSAVAPAKPADSQPLPDFRKLVKQNEPAVVNISSTQAPAPNRRARTPGLPELPGKENPYQEFFKRFFQERPELPEGAPATAGAPSGCGKFALQVTCRRPACAA